MGTGGSDLDIVCIGASAGGVEALVKVVGSLPAELDAAVLVVLHISASGTSALPAILSRAGAMPAAHAVDGEKILKGHIYIAPPDHHLRVGDGVLEVGRGPRENGYRPAINPMFRSAAERLGNRAVAVVLSGALDDGALGSRAVHTSGGLVIVQDPDDALYSSMPARAIEADEPRYILKATDIGDKLHELIGTDGVDLGTMVETEEVLDVTTEDEIKPQVEEMNDLDQAGERSTLVCPECGGTIWEVDEEGVLQFRCHVGHAYSFDAMASEHAQSLEAALWIAMRTLRERAALALRMRERLKARGLSRTLGRYEEEAREANKHALLIRQILDEGGAADMAPDVTEATSEVG